MGYTDVNGKHFSGREKDCHLSHTQELGYFLLESETMCIPDTFDTTTEYFEMDSV